MAALAILGGCHTHHDHDHDHEHEEEAEHGRGHADGVVEISPERQETLGIEIDTVRSGEFHEVIRTSGRILSATGDEMTVVATSDGTVILPGLSEGSAVAKGGRIATISSRNLASGDKLAKAKVAYETAKKEYERDKTLFEDNIVSESHLDKSKMEYEYAKAEYDALVAGGVTRGGVGVTSPISGFVKSVHVSSGDYVQTGTPIATVSQNRRLRLKADVPERHFGRIAEIRDAVFSTAYDGATYRLGDLGGRLVSYGRASDGDYFIPVTFEFDNKGDLIPGSFVEVYLKTSRASTGVFVPLEAITESQGVRYAFVRNPEDDDAFIRREVVLGESDGKDILVTKGLKEGELIVVKGTVHVKLAGVSSVPANHTHNH